MFIYSHKQDLNKEANVAKALAIGLIAGEVRKVGLHLGAVIVRQLQHGVEELLDKF